MWISRPILFGLIAATCAAGCEASNAANCGRRSTLGGICIDGSQVHGPATRVAGGGAEAAFPTNAPGSARAVLDGQLMNARDLGGTPLSTGASVAYDAIFRGPPLAPLRPEGCAEFARLGVRTIIDLRIESERLGKPNAPCAVQQAREVHAPLPVPYDVSPSDYIDDLNATDSIALGFQALGNPDAYPVWFHCTWGRDRSGVFGALVLLSLGATRAEVMQEYLLSRASVGAYPASLEAMLDELARQGGIEAYLAAAGIGADQLAVLRERAVAPAQ